MKIEKKRGERRQSRINYCLLSLVRGGKRGGFLVGGGRARGLGIEEEEEEEAEKNILSFGEC